MSFLSLLALSAIALAGREGPRVIDHKKLVSGIETRLPPAGTRYYAYGVYSRPLMVSVESDMLAGPFKGWLKSQVIPTLTWRRAPDDAVRAWPRKGADVALSDLPPAAIVAAIDVFKREQPGAEVDLLVRDAPGTRVPVTVWWELDRSVTVAVGERYALHEYSPPSRAELEARYGVTLREGEGLRDWGDADLARLDQALALLTPAELGCLREVPFELAERITGQGNAAAVYEYRWDGWSRMVFYKVPSDQSLTAFFGSPFDPVEHYVRRNLHEMAHAIGDARARRVAAARHAAGATELDPDAWRRRGLPSDAEGEWAERMGDTWRPSQYGQENVKEGFADFFALLHVDRPAMERIAPALLPWFDEAAHLDCPDPATLGP